MHRFVTCMYGMGGDISYTINVSENKAMNILNELKNLEDTIKDGNIHNALKIASMLKEDGVFRDNVIFDLIRNHGEDNIAPYSNINDTNFMLKNLMCFVVGYGDALFAYPMDILAIFLLYYCWGGCRFRHAHWLFWHSCKYLFIAKK